MTTQSKIEFNLKGKEIAGLLRNLKTQLESFSISIHCFARTKEFMGRLIAN